jgi:competence protein ComEC
MLTIHFLNVGHGDCTFVEFPSGRLAMIDINNSKSLPATDVEALAERKGISTAKFSTRSFFQSQSWEEHYQSKLVDPYDYYRKHFDGRGVYRYIQTHPDMDHMSGLHRFFWLGKIPLQAFWDVAHDKELEEPDFDNSRYSWQDWLTYKWLRRGKGPSDSTHCVINNLRGSTARYWQEDGITILSPTRELISACSKSEEYNNCSYVLKIAYGGRTVILPGDAEGPAWASMLDALGPDALKCDVLKAAHHGRESGYDEDAVKAMAPAIVICSVGKKPDTDASGQYANHGAEVLSTRFNGTIKLTISESGKVIARDREGEKIAKLAKVPA